MEYEVKKNEYLRLVSRAVSEILKRKPISLNVTYGRFETQRFKTRPDQLTYRFGIENNERTFAVSISYGKKTIVNVREKNGAFNKMIETAETAIPDELLQEDPKAHVMFEAVNNANALADLIEQHVCGEIFK